MKVFKIIICLAFFALNGLHAQTAARTKQFNLEGGLAIQGYDPVAYFTQKKATKGSKQFAATVEGVTYNFASAANKDLFLKEPKKYEPQYGGWCAYALGSNNEKVEIDPETFQLKDGKLYLFYHTWVNNTYTKWQKDESNLRTKADKNWQTIYH